MKILSFRKRIDFDKKIRNVSIYTVSCSDPRKNRRWTDLHIWYERNCEYCPLAWEDRSYEGECEDCGCLFDKDFNVPIWKCMLPKRLKEIIKHKKGW